jgi:vancomycin resistance protein YoaR
VAVVKPTVSGDQPDRLGIKDLVAQGTSNFAGSPPERIQNITRGAQLIDGAIIAPGQVFSFDDTVGDISVANGFTTGLVILDHETQDGVGGGICQVSTTLFRAAFYAGVPIVERHDHAYAVPYYTQGGYPEGFDATIYSPQLDLKFRNDTSAYLLVQTQMDVPTNTLTVSLYGTKTGRVVQLVPGPITNRTPHPPDLLKADASLPKGVTQQVDWAHDGFDTWVKRVVTLNGKVTSTDTFVSQAQPWQAVYLVGTGPASAGKPAKKA